MEIIMLKRISTCSKSFASNKTAGKLNCSRTFSNTRRALKNPRVVCSSVTQSISNCFFGGFLTNNNCHTTHNTLQALTTPFGGKKKKSTLWIKLPNTSRKWMHCAFIYIKNKTAKNNSSPRCLYICNFTIRNTCWPGVIKLRTKLCDRNINCNFNWHVWVLCKKQKNKINNASCSNL